MQSHYASRSLPEPRMIPTGLTPLQQLQRAVTANGPDGSTSQSWTFAKDAAHIGVISDEDMDNEIFRTNGALDLYTQALTESLSKLARCCTCTAGDKATWLLRELGHLIAKLPEISTSLKEQKGRGKCAEIEQTVRARWDVKSMTRNTLRLAILEPDIEIVGSDSHAA